MNSDMFIYGATRKRLQPLYIMFTFLLLFFIAAIGLFIFWGSNPFSGTIFEIIFLHVKAHVSTLSYLGVFYVTFFGGFFFLSVPIEVFFVGALNNHNPFLLIPIALAGASISYTIDYLLGYKLATLSRRLIPIKKFYKIKSLVNRRGLIAILFFNIIGVGSQQMTFVLGVFRYNRTRLFIATLIGQLIKFIGLSLLILI
ncbi:MAG: VTT domain-containing protein [Candidatus Woesearchaeota archaeon]